MSHYNLMITMLILCCATATEGSADRIKGPEDVTVAVAATGTTQLQTHHKIVVTTTIRHINLID